MEEKEGGVPDRQPDITTPEIKTLIAAAGIEIGVEHPVFVMDGQHEELCAIPADSSSQAPVVEIIIAGQLQPVMYTQLPGEHG